jgi:hypothetical protein
MGPEPKLPGAEDATGIDYNKGLAYRLSQRHD